MSDIRALVEKQIPRSISNRGDEWSVFDYYREIYITLEDARLAEIHRQSLMVHVESGLKSLLTGNTRNALRDLSHTYSLLSMLRGEGRDILSGQDPGKLEKFLLLGHIIMRPYTLTLGITKEDSELSVNASIALLAAKRHEGIVRECLSEAALSERKVLELRWQDKKQSEEHVGTLLDEVFLHVRLPENVEECELRFFRNGQLFDIWHLFRTDAKEWKVKRC